MTCVIYTAILLASLRVVNELKHADFVNIEGTFAKYNDIQNMQHLFYSTCANKCLRCIF